MRYTIKQALISIFQVKLELSRICYSVEAKCVESLYHLKDETLQSVSIGPYVHQNKPNPPPHKHSQPQKTLTLTAIP